MKILSIIIGKLSLFILEKMGRGSAMPGTIAYKLNKNILSDFKLPKTVIAVTGSSGKGSTTKIIANVLRKSGYTVAYNDKGSNERAAIIATLLKNSDLKGNIKTDACVFEIDERYVKLVFPYIKPTHVLITNLTKDQPPRQRHYDFVYEEIFKGLNSDAKYIINADDAYLAKFNLDKKFDVVYYGIDKLKTSYKKNMFPVLNTERCPICNSKLEYKYYQIEYKGNYKCTKCDFKRPESKYNINKFKDNIITIKKKYNIELKNDMLYSYYNNLSAFALLSELDFKLDMENVSNIISKMNRDTKIFDRFKYNKHNVYVLNNKNENAATFNESVLYTSQNKNKKTLVIGWWQISRRYDFDDLSWLYDIEFEIIKNIDKVIVAGPQRFDIAVRLKYAGIDEKKIKIYKDLYEAKNEILKSKTDIYAILNFDYIKPFNDIMEGQK